MTTDPAALQYSALVLQNEFNQILQQTNYLLGETDPDDLPELQAVIAAAQGGVGKVGELVTAYGTPPPVDPPIDPPVTGVRDATLQPGDAKRSPWNVPISKAAKYDSRQVIVPGGPVNVSAKNGYGVSVSGASKPYELWVPQPAGEYHYSKIQGDKRHCDEYFRFGQSNQNHMVTDLFGTGVGSGWDVATQQSQLFGTLRLHDLEKDGEIDHSLQIINAALALSPTAKTWPALSGDGYMGSNKGFLPYGSLQAIPPNTTMPGGIDTPLKKKIFRCLVVHGAINADCQGPSGSGTQSFTSFRAEALAEGPKLNEVRAALAICAPLLRWVTNTSTDGGKTNINGPDGERLGPFVAPLG